MGLTRGLTSTGNGEWETPAYVFDPLNAEFKFTLDVCATRKNAKVSPFYTIKDNGLEQPWTGRAWCNPPYGRQIGDWVRTGWEATHQGRAEYVVMLLPARTDTEWWHTWAMNAYEIRLVKGRIPFLDTKHRPVKNPPFPSAIVIFKPGFWMLPIVSSVFFERPT